MRFVGLIPKRKMDLAEKIAETVEKELISHRDVLSIIQSEDFHLQTGKVIRDKIEDFINTRVYGNPLLSMFVSADVVSKLSETIMEELNKEIPGVLDSLFESVETKLDFKKIIREKIEGFDTTRLESIVFSIASRELKSIEYLGGILGFIVGIVQVTLLLLGDIYA